MVSAPPYFKKSIMACFDNIIGIKAPCSPDKAPISGLWLTDYPGITLGSAAQLADENVLTGYNYLTDLRRRAMLMLQSDLLGYITANYRVETFMTNSYRSGETVTPLATIAAGSSSQKRGLVLSKIKTWCRFYKIVVNRIRVYSNTEATITLSIADVNSGVTYTPTVDLVAGVKNEFEINQVMAGDEIQITIPSNISVYSTKPECGCGGRAKNEHFVFNGLNNATVTTTESYGIEADVTLKCDFTNLICDMANDHLIGRAAYELAGAMFYDEMTKTNRLNYLTIYKGEQLAQQAAAGFAAYRAQIETVMSGLARYLTQTDGNCKCIDCGGIQIKANV